MIFLSMNTLLFRSNRRITRWKILATLISFLFVAVEAICEAGRKLGVRVVFAKSDPSGLIRNQAIQEQRNERN